tara:strand:- start:935 stop:1699 length:765 start_codon:yes stop_codon:yes gene_type:complete
MIEKYELNDSIVRLLKDSISDNKAAVFPIADLSNGYSAELSNIGKREHGSNDPTFSQRQAKADIETAIKREQMQGGFGGDLCHSFDDSNIYIQLTSDLDEVEEDHCDLWSQKANEILLNEILSREGNGEKLLTLYDSGPETQFASDGSYDSINQDSRQKVEAIFGQKFSKPSEYWGEKIPHSQIVYVAGLGEERRKSKLRTIREPRDNAEIGYAYEVGKEILERTERVCKTCARRNVWMGLRRRIRKLAKKHGR